MALYSHSRLEAFKKCPRQYYYRYIEKTSTPYEGVEAYMGTQVHSVLEKVYEELGKGHLMSFSTASNYLDHYFDDKWHSDIYIVRKRDGLDRDYYKNLGQTCLKNYYNDYFPFDDGHTIGIEKYVEFEVNGGRDIMRGFVDRISISNGVLRIHDYKTGKKKLGKIAAGRDGQLASYEIAIRSDNPEIKEVELVWHFLQHNENVTSKRTPEQLCQLKDSIEDTIRVIDEHTEKMEFPTKPTKLCSWCSYKNLCPAAYIW